MGEIIEKDVDQLLDLLDPDELLDKFLGLNSIFLDVACGLATLGVPDAGRRSPSVCKIWVGD